MQRGPSHAQIGKREEQREGQQPEAARRLEYARKQRQQEDAAYVERVLPAVCGEATQPKDWDQQRQVDDHREAAQQVDGAAGLGELPELLAQRQRREARMSAPVPLRVNERERVADG